jgi:tetratricopeptide (TPR) repeat protein
VSYDLQAPLAACIIVHRFLAFCPPRSRFGEDHSMIPLLRVSSALRLTLVLACGACAAGGAIRVSDVTPQSIPSLEAQRSQSPQDANVLARLGVAYFKAERYQDARPVLDSAVAHDPNNGVAAVYLGMTAEQLGDFATARTAYQRYVGLASSSELKATAQQRLSLIDRSQREYQARQALANEGALATMPPESNTVAVMPFYYSGTNAQVQPLGRGLAQLLVTDLAKSRQIRVLERERMQAILDEMRLSDSSRADPGTALRSGHMLRAASVVQGTIFELPGDQLRVDAAVVDVASAGVKASAGNQDQLGRLFDLEKALAFRVFNNLGIQLTPAEQEAINQRPTQNIQAFLAYSRGLQSQDQGDYGAAQASFNEAVTIDPRFRAASQGASTATELSVASQQTVTQVETNVAKSEVVQGPASAPVSDDTKQQALTSATQSVAGTSTGQLNSQTQTQTTTQTQSQPPPPPANNSSTATGTQGAAPATGTVVIVIRRPS